jgi:hypothetical protein
LSYDTSNLSRVASAPVPEGLVTPWRRDCPSTGGIDLGLSALYRTSDGPAPRLRVGVMLDGYWTIRCFRHALEDIVASNFASLAAVILNATSDRDEVRSTHRVGRYWKTLTNARSRRSLAYTIYTRFLDGLPASAEDPLSIVDCADLLAGAVTVPVEPVATRFVHRFPQAAIERVRELNLDVLVRFGFNIVRGEILEVPRYGIWSYHHGDPDSYRGGPAHYWEMVEHNPVSGAMLQVLTDELDGGLVLCKGLFSTTGTMSLAENRYGPYWGTQHFLIQKLNELHRYGWDFVRTKAAPASVYAGRRSPYRTPTNTEFLGWTAREIARRSAKRIARSDTETEWSVALRRDAVPLPFDQTADAVGGFRELRNPPGRFLADPFLVEHADRTWLFVEDFAFDSRRAVISCGAVTDEGEVEGLRPCLEMPHHLSYPHVFWHEGTAFMTPESEASGTVELYRATRFPYEWSHETTLIRLRCVDPTVFRHGGLWYLFATHTAVPGQSVMTLLFHAPDLFGPWQLHPASPISTDVRVSRSAGSILEHDGRILRPGQDCSIRYGRALVWNEIHELDASEYRETTVARRDAAGVAGGDGIHHYHRARRWEAIDVRRQSPEGTFAVLPGRDASGRLRAVDVQRRSSAETPRG